MGWKTRKRGSPKQVGKKFPVKSKAKDSYLLSPSGNVFSIAVVPNSVMKELKKDPEFVRIQDERRKEIGAPPISAPYGWVQEQRGRFFGFVQGPTRPYAVTHGYSTKEEAEIALLESNPGLKSRFGYNWGSKAKAHIVKSQLLDIDPSLTKGLTFTQIQTLKVLPYYLRNKDGKNNCVKHLKIVKYPDSSLVSVEFDSSHREGISSSIHYDIMLGGRGKFVSFQRAEERHDSFSGQNYGYKFWSRVHLQFVDENGFTLMRKWLK